MRGLVTVTKVFKDGTRERVCTDSPNIATQGFAHDIVNLMTAGAKKTTSDHKFAYFQVGTSSYYDSADWTEALPYSTVRNFSRLKSPISTAAGYGENTSLELVTRKAIVYKEDFVPVEDIEYDKESMVLGVLNEDNAFSLDLTKEENGIIVKITLDDDALIGESIREFGLFTKNPDSNISEDNPILTCYKSLDEPIEKTGEFGLEIDWVIQFTETLRRTEEYAKLISWYPAAVKRKIGNRYTGQFVGYLEAGDLEEVVIETPVPTIDDAYIYYNVYEDGDLNLNEYAVSGEHWKITDASGNETSAFNSPIFWPKGETQIKFYVSALDTGEFHGQKTLLMELSSYTGRDKTIDTNDRLDGNINVWYIRSKRDAPNLAFSSGSYTATAGTDLSSSVSSDGSKYEASAFIDVSTNASSYNLGVHNSDGSRSYTGPHDASSRYHVIPITDTNQVFSVSSRDAGDYTVTLLNTPSGEPAYNRNTYSQDLRGSFQRITNTSGIGVPDNLNYFDISANREDIRTGYDGKWTVENGMFTTANMEGFPTPHLQTLYDVYPVQPPDGVVMRNFFHDTQPDGIQPAQFFYVPQEYYVWPDTTKSGRVFNPSPVKKRPGQYDYLQDGTGRRSGGDWETQVSQYSSDMSTVVFSTYVKKLDNNGSAVMEDPNRTTVPTPSATSNDNIQVNIIVRGYVGVGFYSSQRGKTSTFKWNDQGGLDAVRVDIPKGSAFRMSNPNSISVRYTSSVGYDTYMTDSDIGKELSSSQYGILGEIAGDDIGIFPPKQAIAPVASGYINVVSSTSHVYDVDSYADTTGHILSAVNGNLTLSSLNKPEVNLGPFGFTSSGPGILYDCGVFSGTNNGDTTASADMAAYGYTDPFCRDGWYRVWTAAVVPADFTEDSIYARASSASGGAFHERNIFVSREPGGNSAGITQADTRAGIQGNTGSYYEVPTVASGALLAWNQYESFDKTDPFFKDHTNTTMPRPYQSRPSSWFTPRGNAFTDGLATSSISLTFNP